MDQVATTMSAEEAVVMTTVTAMVTAMVTDTATDITTMTQRWVMKRRRAI